MIDFRNCNIEIPVIAAVDGAYGAGLSMALSADFVLCSKRAKLCCVFPRVGLVTDVGAFSPYLGWLAAKQRNYLRASTGRDGNKDLGIAMEVHETDNLMSAAMN